MSGDPLVCATDGLREDQTVPTAANWVTLKK